MVHVFSGHATEVEGLKCLILNELADDDDNFCKAYKAEADIRTLATKFPASYHIAIFTCQTFNDLVVEEYEESGNIIVSPRNLVQLPLLDIYPSTQLIRMIGLSDK